MMDMRRTLLWVVFTMSLILLWDAWNKHNGEPTLFGAPIATPAPAVPGSAASGLPAPVGGVPAVAGAAGAVPAGAPAVAAREKITVTTDLFKVTLDSMGAAVSRVELLKYQDHSGPNTAWYEPVLFAVGLKQRPPELPPHNIVVLDETGHRYVAQTGFIPTAGGGTLPTHFTQMTATPGERTLKDGANEVVLRFESPEVGGTKLVKTYTFKRGEYTIGVKHELVNVGTAPLQPQLYLQLERDGNPPPGESAFYFTFTGPAIYTEQKKFEKIDFKDIAKREPGELPKHVTQANDGWIGMVQHYFASAWLVPGNTPRAFRSAKVQDNVYSLAMVQPLGDLAPGATKTHEATLFVGPQEEKKLAALAPGLELVKDYGWFTILSKPLFWVLDHLHQLLGNWGWSIIGLVVLLKIAFYWLNAKAYSSMAKMKAINPRVMELRERYKDKPQQMQQEMMRIYKEEKVNPLGGCLPIFVQMPFFIALYWVLLSSVEMRNAPWIGWISDLSVSDPFFILPILMTLSSLLQVWLNPTPPDPMQAKMMWIMPLMFSFMFFAFPAGLVLYWLTNNILSIAQQYVINKRLGVT